MIQHPNLFSQDVIDEIQADRALDFLFKGAHYIRNKDDFQRFITDQRVQVFWRKFIKAKKHEIFNSMDINSIRGMQNLEQCESLLNEVSNYTGIVFKIQFE